MESGALIITIIFMLLAVLVAVGLLAVVALPHLRARRESDAIPERDRRHTSRTARDSG